MVKKGKVLLTIILIVIILFPNITSVYAEEYIDGGVYKDMTAPLITNTTTFIKTYDSTVGTPMFFRFIPLTNDNYTIETIGTVDTEGEIYDSAGNSLEVQDDVIDINFQINRQLNAGETYYLRVTNYSMINGDQTILRIVGHSGGVLSNPAKEITAFNFSGLIPNVTGIVNEVSKTIALTVPYGTDVTALVPTITHTGASISPNTGVARDFTNPVIYTVTAADSSTQTYTVTVTVAANPAKAITAFNFNGLTLPVTGTVNEASKTIALTVPYATDVTALVPTITHTGASVSPNTGVAWDFTNPVEYTVTAADSSTQKYTVTVTVLANPAKAITAFNFNGLTLPVTGTVNEASKTIALTVPFGTDVTALVPTITHTGASVSPYTGVAQNFTSPVEYTVTAADSSTQKYTVTVTVAANPAKAISAFNFNGLNLPVTGTVNEASKTIALTVPYGTDITALVPTITHTGASISPNTGVAWDFTNPVTYTVTAADSSTQTYTVTVTVAANPAKEITAFNFNGLNLPVTGTVNEASKTIALTVPYGTDITALVPTITHTGASISPNTGVAQNFTSPVEYTVTAADSSTQKYTVTVTVAVIEYTITYTAGTGGTITGAATQTVNSGADGEAVTAIPNSGYDFVGWSDGVTTATRTDSNVTGNITVTANFARNTSTLPSDTSVTIPTPGVEILINNDKVDYTISDINVENSKKITTIILDDEKLTIKLNKENHGSTVTIPISNNSDIVIGQLSGQTVKNMEVRNAILEIKTEYVTYTIPTVDINIDSILKSLGSQVQLKDIKVQISVSKSSKETITKVEESASTYNFKIVVNPVDFEITCTSQGKTVEVSKFNGYVERSVAIPDGIDPTKITTGVILNEDGTFSHVPTAVKLVDGKYYAKINSLTNSTYTLIWNPVTFQDVEKHWSKDYVNSVGSRMIDDGVGNSSFAPNRAITRAEFASMIVKALGLKGTNFQEKFKDVKESDPNYYDIYTAYEYGIIEGYSNGTFGPQDLITREQAMTMLVKAMDIAGMDVKVSKSDVKEQLNRFKDSSKISLGARLTATICLKNDIFVGDKKGSLNPKGNLTRGESATVIIRVLKKAGLI